MRRGRPPIHPFKRILAKTRKINGCWIYTGCPSVEKYPTISDEEGKSQSVHRYVYKLIKRRKLPYSIKVCHKCDNPRCWRPSHLFQGTQTDNLRDASKKGRTASGEKHGCATLSRKQVEQIRDLYHAGGYTYKELARRFKVAETNIGAIVRRETWK